MEDRIYLKTRNDGLWEKNATKGAAVYMIVGTVLFLASINILVPIETFLEHKLGSSDRLSDFITTVWALSGIFGISAICILTNQSRNISKSTGFILRKGQLYVVQLFYTHKKLGTETDRRMIHAPAGSAEQIASLPNNIEVANDVQAHEREVRARRDDPASFIEGLDDILLFLAKNPDVYYAIPDSERTSLDKIFKTNLQNAAPFTINTENAQYGFFKLNNPRVVEENRKYFILNFDNEYGDVCTAKFTNCFGNLVDDIKNDFQN